ncbi:MAG: sensor domain-containing diguanylate cyclase, partial [Spirochaetia bacterium]|nr:sensor domain-containing diguanylate cyclase [Spirochaetia bacterium]
KYASHLRLIIDTVPGYIFVKDNNGRFILVNKTFADVFGMSPDAVVGKKDIDYGASEELINSYLETDRKVMESGVPLIIPEEQVLRKDRSLGWFQTIKTPYINPYFKKPAVLGVSIDITERKLAKTKLMESEKRYRFIAENAADVIWILDLEKLRFIYVSPSVMRLRGFTPEEVIELPFDASLSHESMLLLERIIPENIEKYLNGCRETYLVEIEQPCKDGGSVWTEVTSRIGYDEETGRLLLYGVSRDITERRLNDEKMRYMAQYDSLTNLPNRALFFDRLGVSLRLARRENTKLSLMFLDLDRFKPVNDTYGHSAGDIVLKEVSARIQKIIRSSDTAGRIGGDEFVICLYHVESKEELYEIAEKFRLALESPYFYKGNKITISASIGFALFPEHGTDENTLVCNADTAMYKAKKMGRNQVAMYTP